MPKETSLLLIAFCLALVGVARAEDWSVWRHAYDPETRTRFIPVELWTAAPWDGTQDIRMASAALEFGQRGDKSIKGPTTWNGTQVYERLNRDKRQRFAIRDDRTGLGRVFDSRYPQLGCASTGSSWKGVAAAPICATCTARCAGRSTCGGTSSDAACSPSDCSR